MPLWTWGPTLSGCLFTTSCPTAALHCCFPKEMAGLANYISDGALTREGIDRACGVLMDFRAILRQFGMEELRVFAAAFLRNIRNTEEAVAAIRRWMGTEIVEVREDRILRAQSLPIGSLNLFNRHVSKIWPKREELEGIRRDIRQTLHSAHLPGGRPGASAVWAAPPGQC